MQIELESGENLTILTPRGTVILQWICDTDNLIVGVGSDVNTTHVRTRLDKSQFNDQTVMAEIILDEIE